MLLAKAMMTYFAIVFGAGFILGPIRTLWLEPQLGPFASVAIEAPVLLAAMVFAAWISTTRFAAISIRQRAAVGLGALALVIVADFSVGLALRQQTAAAQWDYLSTPAGRIYVLLLGIFGLMPMLLQMATRGHRR